MNKKGRESEEPKRLQLDAIAAAAATPLMDVMSLVVLSAMPDQTVESLTSLLVQSGVSGAPVLDGGRLIGIVSQTDLLRQPPEATAREIMTPIAITLRETDSLAHAAQLMAAKRIHRIPVVDADGRVVGIISALDLARWLGYRGP